MKVQIFDPCLMARIGACVCGMLCVLGMAGCQGKSKSADGPPPSPVEVGVLDVRPTPVTLLKDLPGRVSALRIAEIRARVSGIVQKRYFNEGSDVKAGQALYQIDPVPYEAALDNARGSLAKAKATVEEATLNEQRYRKLLGSRTVSQQDYDSAVADLHSGEADVLSGEAEVKQAEINLGYTRVTSPVSGRIGVSLVTEGAYVRDSDATLMATVQQLDQVYVDVTQSSNELLRMRRQVANGEIETNGAGQSRVKLTLDDGTAYDLEGTLQFSDVTVDPSTSSVKLRAIFPNPDETLLPGLFVRARLVEGEKKDAILVPQLAVSRNRKGEAVAYVVGSDGKAEERVLRADRSVGNQWLVDSGLKTGDQLIVSNLQSVRVGTPVKAQPASLAAAYLPSTAAD